MAQERLLRMSLYETRAIVPLTVHPVGVFEQPLHIEGNSILSSVFFKSGPGSVKVDYYDTTTGTEVGEEFSLDSHDLISSPTTDRILVTRVHNKPIVRVTVTGGSAEFGIYITVVASFASDLDSALVRDIQTANLVTDKAMIAASYDAISGQFKFLRSINGRLLVDASIGNVSTETVANVELTLADTEYSYTLPANTGSYMVKTKSGHDFKYSPVAGQSGITYLTLPVYEKNGVEPITTRIIYFQSNRAGEVMEISSWV